MTQIRPNIEIVGSINVEENTKDRADDESESKKPYNLYLDKYAKSNGHKNQEEDPNLSKT